MFRYVTLRAVRVSGLNFTKAAVIMKLPLQEARIERN
jgi:hypothetical protein